MSYDPHPFAAALLSARSTCTAFTPTDDIAQPRSMAEAYAVQTVVSNQLGPAGAFKTGRKDACDTSIMAPIPQDCVRSSPALFDTSQMRMVGVELEIAFRLETGPPAPSDPDFEERLRSAASVVAVIEVVDCRLSEVDNPDPIAKLADNQFGYGLVVGEPIPLTSDQSLDTATIQFRANSTMLGDGPVDVPGGDAFATFAAFARMVGTHCGGLHAGQVVTTGALSGLHFIDKHADVEGTIAGLGSVSARFGGAV